MRWTVPIVLLLTFIYASVRYVGFKGVDASQIPLYVVKKGVAWAAVVLIGLAPLRRLREDRTRLGKAGFYCVVLHAIMSLAVLSPGYFPDFYRAEANRLLWNIEFSLLTGVIGFLLIAILMLDTSYAVAPDASDRNHRRRGWGRLVLALAIAHAGFLGFTKWIAPTEWPGGIPPVSLAAAVSAAWLLIERSLRAR